MAEMVADAFISLALGKIRDLLMEEGKFLLRVKNEAETLQSELELVLWFLKDAEAKNMDKDRIQTWVLKFREIAYEAEDVLESYVFSIKSRSSHSRQGVIRSLKRRSTWILSEAWKTRQVGLQIQDLMTKIGNLKESFEKYGVRAIIEGGGGSSVSLSTKQVLRRTYSHVVEDDFVGLENDVEMLVERIVGSDDRVVFIYGMGGLGKTTLAGKVYNHPWVRRGFDAFAWVCISQEWQTLDILQRILSKLEKREGGSGKLVDEMVRELYDAQENKKCLFVLDDIWSIDAWECIKHAIRRDTKILFTSRNKEVALHVAPTGFHHQPRLLDEEECCDLLQKKALFKHGFLNKEVALLETGKFEALAREMAKNCGGLPLAVVVLGGILATKQSIEEWQIVNRNIKHFLVQENGRKEHRAAVLQEILSLSYDDLPHRLKPCFLYLAAFPEDTSINAEYLYHLWMGEGLLSLEDKIGEEETLMNVAERSLGELVERCMVQVEAKQIPTVIKFESCRLHDLMRDLCVKKAKEENFLQLIDKQHQVERVVSSSKIRRLKMTVNKDNAVDCFSRMRGNMIKDVRSLHLFVDQDEDDGRVMHLVKAQLKECKRLRVLVLEGLMPNDFESVLKSTFYMMCDHYHLPKSIGNLSHLRFLDVRDSLFLMIPSALGKLENLEILDLRKLATVMSQNMFHKLQNLRCLYLPNNWGHVNLLEFDKLEKLEILENFDTRSCNHKDLFKLANLRQLGVTIRKMIAFLVDFIKGVSNLRKLSHVSLMIDEFDGLSEELSISFRQGLEERSIFSQSLKVLRINGVAISLEALERFPNLQKLELVNCDFGREIVCHSNGFPQLKAFELKGLEDLETWKVEEGAMSNLCFLKIKRCLKLEMIPDGLRFVKSLKELNIFCMPVEFVNRVGVVDGQEGPDFHKVRHVASIDVKW